jgi:hypothetical protein
MARTKRFLILQLGGGMPALLTTPHGRIKTIRFYVPSLLYPGPDVSVIIGRRHLTDRNGSGAYLLPPTIKTKIVCFPREKT